MFKEISKRQLFLWGGFIFIRSVLQLFGYSRAASSLSIRFGSLGINELYGFDLSRDITLPPLYTFVTKPSELKAHLALKCPMVNHDIKIKYLQLVIILINDCFYFYIVLVIKIFNKSKI